MGRRHPTLAREPHRAAVAVARPPAPSPHPRPFQDTARAVGGTITLSARASGGKDGVAHEIEPADERGPQRCARWGVRSMGA